jgi:hypothetical protein
VHLVGPYADIELGGALGKVIAVCPAGNDHVRYPSAGSSVW